MNPNDISVVVVSPVSTYIDSHADVALSNIRELAKAGLADKVHVYSRNGAEIQGAEQHDLGDNYELPGLASDVILAGGALGDEHYDVLEGIVRKAASEDRQVNIHIPLDSNYLAEEHNGSGDTWYEGVTAFEKYAAAIEKEKAAATAEGRDPEKATLAFEQAVPELQRYQTAVRLLGSSKSAAVDWQVGQHENSRVNLVLHETKDDLVRYFADRAA